jgi:hypothetical protein
LISSSLYSNTRLVGWSDERFEFASFFSIFKFHNSLRSKRETWFSLFLRGCFCNTHLKYPSLPHMQP